MKSTDELEILQLADKLIAKSASLRQQSQGLSGVALYLETLANDYDHLAKDIKNILLSPQTLLDLPLEVL